MTGYARAVVVLHALGLALLALAADPALAGAGALAYVLGLRHAFDPDHVAAIDNAGRKLRADGAPAGGVGFWFALGHCTLVLAACVVGARVGEHGAGALVSGAFLCAIGLVNLGALVRGGSVLARPLRHVRAAWHLYPVGFLFGLGFDTAAQVGLLALSAGGAGLATLALPLLFAAGMTLIDGAAGALAAFAASSTLLTSISIALALGIGVTELARIPVDIQLIGYASTCVFATAFLLHFRRRLVVAL